MDETDWQEVLGSKLLHSSSSQCMLPLVHLVSLHRGHKLTIAGDRFLTADNCLSYEDNTWPLKIKLKS